MRLHYYVETDSFYIDLSDKVSADSQEVAPGAVLDFDAEGALVGIYVDHASKVVNLSGQRQPPSDSQFVWLPLLYQTALDTKAEPAEASADT